MLKMDWKPTNTYYRQILDAPDPETRYQRYLDLLVKPWKPMMDMMGGAFGPQGDDPLAGARGWLWLLPDQAEKMAELLASLEAANAWTIGCEALAEALAHFEPYADRIPFDTVTGWLALADPEKANPADWGYTGATDWTRPWFIGQFWDVTDENQARLPGLVAHEMHHLIRLRAFPWDMQKTSVAEYIVVEGTAESFATSLFGEENVGFFVSACNPDDLETARALIGKGLHETGFNTIRSYVFGDALAERSGYKPLGGMPPYGGYAVGYHVVQAFLKRTGLTIEEATFLPATEIVERSGYFA